MDQLAQQLGPLVREIDSESDRGRALIAAAFLDDMLDSMLRKFFVADDGNTESLLGNQGPIDSFGARTRVAFAVGLIGKRELAGLNNLRKIRNQFAHSYSGSIKFDHQPVRDWIVELDNLLGAKFASQWPKDLRKAFLFHVSLLMSDLLFSATVIRQQEEECEMRRTGDLLTVIEDMADRASEPDLS